MATQVPRERWVHFYPPGSPTYSGFVRDLTLCGKEIGTHEDNVSVTNIAASVTCPRCQVAQAARDASYMYLDGES